MYQRDFILRMIEMLAQMVAGILGLIKKGDYRKASEQLESAYMEFLKEDSSLFIRIPKEKLTESLLKEHHYESGHLEMLAELFFVEGELKYAQGFHKESREFFEKSILLFEFTEKESRSFSLERKIKINTISQRLNQINSI